MSRNAIVIGANQEAVFSIQLAHLHGLKVYALDGNPEAAGMAKADEAFPVDINDLDKVFAITDPLEPAVVVPAPIGHCLTTIGALNDRYCIAGVSEHSARICTDKYLFHKTLSEDGFRDAKARLVRKGTLISREKADRIYKDVSEHGEKENENNAQVILKPRNGSGSRGVVICEDADSLWMAMRNLDGGKRERPDDSVQRNGKGNGGFHGFPEDYIVETCVPGEEYGVDGGYVGGEFHLTLLRHKRNTPLPYRQCVGYVSVLPEEAPAFYQNCVRLLQEVGEKIGLMNCVVHADVIRRNQKGSACYSSAGPELSDEPFLIEMSARPSGHNLSNLFTPLATGTTIVDDFLKLALREKPEGDYRVFCRNLFRPKYTKKLLIRYFDLKPGKVAGLPDPGILRGMMKEKTLLQYHCTIRVGEVLKRVTNGASIMNRGYFILQGRTDEDLEESAERVLLGFEMVPLN